jgi:hypothetical protein
MSKYVQLTTSNTISYDDVLFSDHSVRVLAGQEAMKSNNAYQFIYAPDVNPDIPYVQTAPQTGVEGEQGYSAETLLSYFGMIDYNYAAKYIFRHLFVLMEVHCSAAKMYGVLSIQ